MNLLNIMSNMSRLLDLNDLELAAVLVVSIYLLFVIMRLFGIYKKEDCPECQGRLTRKKRNSGDYMAKILTLAILPFRRYKCIHCGWEGIRWKVEKEIKKAPRP